jgi:hypothetical protein
MVSFDHFFFATQEIRRRQRVYRRKRKGKKKKSPALGGAHHSGKPVLSCSNRSRRHVNHMLVQSAFVSKGHIAVNQSKQGVVFAHTDVVASVEFGASLAHNNGSSGDEFTTESFHTEHLGV